MRQLADDPGGERTSSGVEIALEPETAAIQAECQDSRYDGKPRGVQRLDESLGGSRKVMGLEEVCGDNHREGAEQKRCKLQRSRRWSILQCAGLRSAHSLQEGLQNYQADDTLQRLTKRLQRRGALHLRLLVIFEADLVDQSKLGFQEIDVFFFRFEN